jgi:nitrilase
MNEPFLAAAAQVAPAFLDREGCLEVARQWIAEAGRQNVRLLVFPETWFPGYPIWLDTSPGAALWNHPPAKAIFRRLFENSISIPSDTTAELCKAAAEAGLCLVMGLNERLGATLYNTILYISDQGEILGLHRKLVPTYTERMIWGQGDGSTLVAVDTSAGRIGGLVCWEHWMPLARQAMHETGEIAHAAVWPTVGETHLLASRAYAFEGRCYVIAAGSVLRRENLPTGFKLLDEMPGEGPWMMGGSSIIAPDASILAGPAGDREELVSAVIDPGRIPEEKMTLDVCGHYARPDVFRFEVRE